MRAKEKAQKPKVSQHKSEKFVKDYNKNLKVNMSFDTLLKLIATSPVFVKFKK
jgi:hypothetical protein